jgi:uncharacterized protein with GYD domain
MAKFLVDVTYTKDGVQGLMKDGGSKRRDVVNKLVKGLGGKVEAFYFAFGSADAVLIVDLPDSVTAAALSLTVGASGAVRLVTTPLLTPEDIDAATKKSIPYKAPGK